MRNRWINTYSQCSNHFKKCKAFRLVYASPVLWELCGGRRVLCSSLCLWMCFFIFTHTALTYAVCVAIRTFPSIFAMCSLSNSKIWLFLILKKGLILFEFFITKYLSSLPKGTSTLRPLGDAMGTPPAWPVTWSMIKNTQCTWHWQVDAYDAS